MKHKTFRWIPAVLLAAMLLAGCAVQPVAATTARYRVTVVAKSRESEFWKPLVQTGKLLSR